jgi:hypothetical protein
MMKIKTRLKGQFMRMINNEFYYYRKPQKCPYCQKRKLAEVMYGMPSFEFTMSKEYMSGDVIIGGCGLKYEEPLEDGSLVEKESWKCKWCKKFLHRIYKEEQQQEEGEEK